LILASWTQVQPHECDAFSTAGRTSCTLPTPEMFHVKRDTAGQGEQCTAATQKQCSGAHSHAIPWVSTGSPLSECLHSTHPARADTEYRPATPGRGHPESVWPTPLSAPRCQVQKRQAAQRAISTKKGHQPCHPSRPRVATSPINGDKRRRNTGMRSDVSRETHPHQTNYRLRTPWWCMFSPLHTPCLAND
jgi:hypothetical protein